MTAVGIVHHNLHKDMFYIPDPTLAFVGVPYYNSTFSFFDTQAQVVARVFAGEVALPARAEMEAEFDARWRVKKKKGVQVGDKIKEVDEVENPEAAPLWGKKFHSLLGLDEAFTDELLAWVNPQVEAAGGTPVTGPDEAWRARYRQMLKERAWRWKAEEDED
ncbi:thiol-specific monooxygenase [Magnaporthiopsis poae ATCC 64411]|uniref:Thiol-specific monooxygenase n=1 Tax=Magnaporthiopsis poae (strain ATCC 64411 / 73-15) TaxID=644358 RepID=A0A0C4DZ41_MAGP6|nr:thiol-specific monooxygenase [Magnaporthiopsis poae ATCC 64411]